MAPTIGRWSSRTFELCFWPVIIQKFHYSLCLAVTWNHMALHNDKVNCKKCIQVMLRVCLKLRKCWVECWKPANAHLWFIVDKPLVLARYITSYIIVHAKCELPRPVGCLASSRDMPLKKSLDKVTASETDMVLGGK